MTTHQEDVEGLVGELRNGWKRMGEVGHQMLARTLFDRAADLLSSQGTEIDRLAGERDAAIREMTTYARQAGEATGRLETSEAAGIVDGWRERAQSAEALSRTQAEENARLREALEPFAATGVILDPKPRDEAAWAGQVPAPPITFGHLRRAANALARTPSVQGDMAGRDGGAG